MTLTEIEEILLRYKKEEDKIESMLNLKQPQGQDFSTERSIKEGVVRITPEKAKERNKTLLKDLEVVKGNLRAKSIYSPTEMQWEKICKRYQSEPSLPVTSWRCHLSVFV